MQHKGLARLVAAVVVVAAGGWLVIASGRPAGAQAGDPLRPKRHFQIQRPAQLTKTEAVTIYQNIGSEVAQGYAVSGESAALEYPKWRRFNDAPYKSKTHGNRYVNNFANAIAAETYGHMRPHQAMPAGAVLAKDSFTVTADGAVFAGALFVMEKLAAGTKPEDGDWRYVMIMPDGSHFGDSTGDGAERVNFCDECHEKEKLHDRLFFLPEAYRRRFLRE